MVFCGLMKFEIYFGMPDIPDIYIYIYIFTYIYIYLGK